jgi:hypothetical protein
MVTGTAVAWFGSCLMMTVIAGLCASGTATAKLLIRKAKNGVKDKGRGVYKGRRKIASGEIPSYF